MPKRVLQNVLKYLQNAVKKREVELSEFFKILKSVVSDYGRHVTGSKIKEFESEDLLSKTLLQQNLCASNSKRIISLSVPIAVIAIVSAVFILINMNLSSLAAGIISLLGVLVILFGCSFTAIMVFREYRSKKSDIKKQDRYVIIFWSVFSVGMLLLCISDFSINVFPYRFYLYLITMTVFPLFDIKKSIVFIIPFSLLNIVIGVIFGIDFYILMISVAFTAAYFMISTLVYSSYCCIFISDRQLNTANERCRQINEKDSLTGLLNKKGLIRRLMDIIDRDTDKNIAAIFFDIDDFRQYNHIYTDTQSDECLYNVCNCVRIIAKSKTDIISRLSGDEFVIIVQDISEYDLVYFAEQIRKSVETMALPFRDGKPVTITVGISSIIEDDFTDYTKLFNEAEDSLSLAKNNGKNCVGYMGNVFKAR